MFVSKAMPLGDLFSVISDAFNSITGGISNVFNDVGKLVEHVGNVVADTVTKSVQSVGNIGQNILNNPLPFIVQTALVASGLPPAAAAAIVSAAKGGSIQDIATAYAKSYLIGQTVDFVSGQISALVNDIIERSRAADDVAVNQGFTNAQDLEQQASANGFANGQDLIKAADDLKSFGVTDAKDLLNQSAAYGYSDALACYDDLTTAAANGFNSVESWHSYVDSQIVANAAADAAAQAAGYINAADQAVTLAQNAQAAQMGFTDYQALTAAGNAAQTDFQSFVPNATTKYLSEDFVYTPVNTFSQSVDQMTNAAASDAQNIDATFSGATNESIYTAASNAVSKAFAPTGLPNAIGDAIARIGVAMALNGGNATKAIDAYLFNLAGRVFYNIAKTEFSSLSLAKAAQAGAAAALSGQNAGLAVINSLLSSGYKSLTGKLPMNPDGTPIDQSTTPVDTIAVDTSAVVNVPVGSETVPVDTTAVAGTITSVVTSTGLTQEVLPDGSTITHNTDGSLVYQYATVDPATGIASSVTDASGVTTNYDANGYPLGQNSPAAVAQADATGTPPPAAAPDVSASSLFKTIANYATQLGSAAISVLGTITAVKTAGQPAARVAQPYQTSTGAVGTPNRNGTITTRLPTGKITTALMPAGTPFIFPDSTTIVNNGNGTYTTIDPTGRQTITSYTATATGSTSGGSLALLAAGAYFLLGR